MAAKKKSKQATAQRHEDVENEAAVQTVPDTDGGPSAADDHEDTTNLDDEGNDLGGLMSIMSKLKKNPKKSKKKQVDDEEEDAAAILAKIDALEAAEKDAAGNENDTVANPKKGKANVKKGGKKGRNNDDDEDAAAILQRLDAEEAAAKATTAVTSSMAKETSNNPQSIPSAEVDNSNDDAFGVKSIKSKKEKEKERKERQKQAEKAKKAESIAMVQAAVASAEKDSNTPAGEAADPSNISSKSKKKNSKNKDTPSSATAEPTATTSTTQSATAPKKKGGAIGALQQMLAAKKAAEEEAKRLEEEERRRIEEEAAREAEAERAKAEAKALKKEREKQKIEELKKAGKYQTPAQKQAAAIAAQRLQALLAAGGAKVEGLEKKGSDVPDDKKPKRVVYGKKKKAVPKSAAEPTRSDQTESVTVAVENDGDVASDDVRIQSEAQKLAAAALGITADAASKENEKDVVKDDWDASSEDETKLMSDIVVIEKDNWDDESEDEKPREARLPSPLTKTEEQKLAAAGSYDHVVEKAIVEPDSVEISSVGNVQVSASLDHNNQEESEEEEDDDSEEDESEEEGKGHKISAAKKAELLRKLEAARKREAAHQEALRARSKDDLRSPICCILGHVDTGKTKVLDKIRQTNVQEGEAGGITQQIGATFFPMDAIRQKTAELHKGVDPGYKLPGLLIIDTPGHESFTNLRSRGSSLCNIAVLVVDIMHGLEQQTLESLGLLRQRKTPFVVALNKIDRIYGWKSLPNCPVQDSLKQQPDFVIAEFNERVEKTKLAFAEQGLNAELYYNNKNVAKNVSLVPTSAITGEGIPDLLHLLVDLTQNRLTERLMYLSELECTVLEVKVIEGLGTTIDVILSNGVLREGDKIILCGLNGPIVTHVRALLTPEPMRELRIKSAYVHHKMVKASLGVKISATGLEKAIAGSRLMVMKEDDDVEDFEEEIMSDFAAISEKFITPGRGVCVQASTLGSLEALLTFLKSSDIPVSGYNIGPVHKKDIIRCSTMVERHPEFAMLLCFDVAIDRDAEEMAESKGIKIFRADIIYHLFDQFTAHMKAIDEQKRKDAAPNAVFPCILRIIPGMVFNKRSPIIMGVDVVEGVLKIGTPICVVDENRNVTSLGKCTSIEVNRRPLQECKKAGPSVSIKLEVPGYDTPKMFGRHFTEENELYSHISRASIDILKSTFRNDLSMEDWKTVKKIKGILNIPDM
ncbi:hypothetical protein HDU84_003358 [Entophlyctis sp. JEL0112]|nr:hypothetical protein HDU84_003358 [Entophlyctis sp. JEL0112]